MTVKFVTHALKTGEITVMGHVFDVATVKGNKISRIGAVSGQESLNPATIHINLETVPQKNPEDLLVLMLGLQDAVELGIQLLAMGIEDNPTASVDEIRERLVQLVAELDRTLQVSH